MEALASGFCSAALTQALAPTEVAEWHQRWPQPTLQVVDIQRYPRTPTVVEERSRFYVAASDGQGLVWLVVPPLTPLEDAIAGFELEVGCCVTLLGHRLVTAANGMNVVVPLQVRFSPDTRRLLGQPSCPASLFPLSANSLVQRSVEVVERTRAVAAPQRPSHPVAVRDFVDSPEKALGNWAVTARVVWRGREYQVNNQSRPFATGSAPPHSSDPPRFVLRCLLVDAHGDGIVAAFFGGEALLERVQLHDILLLSQGTVKWGVGDVAAPVELQFGEKSVEALLDSREEGRRLPLYAAALVGEVARDLRTVRQVLEEVRVGDFTSVVGIVAAVQASAQITTKRGRVSRAVVTVVDETPNDDDPSKRGGASLDVTLWGEVAESAEPRVGERWLFHSCAVQLFQQRKTLSSRQSTMAVQLRALEDPREAAGGCDGAGVIAAPPERDVPAAGEAGTVPAVSQPSMQFVLDIHESSPTLPLLARVQEVAAPLLSWTCTGCRETFHGVLTSSGDEYVPARCHACQKTELAPSCRMSVTVSDGLSAARVALHGSAAESLVGLSAVGLARLLHRQSGTAMSRALRSQLVGAPVLLWLVELDKDTNSGCEFVVAACRRVQYGAGCQTLLSALDAFEESVDGSLFTRISLED